MLWGINMCSLIVGAYFCQFEASKIFRGERGLLGSFNLVVDNFRIEILSTESRRVELKTNSLHHQDISHFSVFTAN